MNALQKWIWGMPFVRAELRRCLTVGVRQMDAVQIRYEAAARSAREGQMKAEQNPEVVRLQIEAQRAEEGYNAAKRALGFQQRVMIGTYQEKMNRALGRLKLQAEGKHVPIQCPWCGQEPQ